MIFVLGLRVHPKIYTAAFDPKRSCTSILQKRNAATTAEQRNFAIWIQSLQLMQFNSSNDYLCRIVFAALCKHIIGLLVCVCLYVCLFVFVFAVFIYLKHLFKRLILKLQQFLRPVCIREDVCLYKRRKTVTNHSGLSVDRVSNPRPIYGR